MPRDYRIDTEEDFILSKRYDNSLEKILDKFPDGVPDKIAASVVQLSVEEYNLEYKKGLEVLRCNIAPESEGVSE